MVKLIFNKRETGKEQSFQQLSLVELHIHVQKNEVGSLPYIIFKKDQRTKCKS